MTEPGGVFPILPKSSLVVCAAWHGRHPYGLARARLSTTVNADLLDGARRVRLGVTDAALIDEAIRVVPVWPEGGGKRGAGVLWPQTGDPCRAMNDRSGCA